jgi:hypothetical protein
MCLIGQMFLPIGREYIPMQMVLIAIRCLGSILDRVFTMVDHTVKSSSVFLKKRRSVSMCIWRHAVAELRRALTW